MNFVAKVFATVIFAALGAVAWVMVGVSVRTLQGPVEVVSVPALIQPTTSQAAAFAECFEVDEIRPVARGTVPGDGRGHLSPSCVQAINFPRVPSLSTADMIPAFGSSPGLWAPRLILVDGRGADAPPAVTGQNPRPGGE